VLAAAPTPVPAVASTYRDWRRGGGTLAAAEGTLAELRALAGRSWHPAPGSPLLSAHKGIAMISFAAHDIDFEDLGPATTALKTLAADPALRAAFVEGPALSRVLGTAAKRYIVAEDRDTLAGRLKVLADKGYRTGVEHVGEEAVDPAEIEGVVHEYLHLIDEADPVADQPVQLGFDLSNVGLLVSAELAVRNTARILEAARAKNMGVVISMERSGFVDSIVDAFDELAPHHANVGLTLQAHLHRTTDDLSRVARHGRKVRLVKGVYRESPDVALPRGPELDARYADLAERLLSHGVELACATQDPHVHELLDRRGLLSRIAELEMLHGVRPALLRAQRERGIPCRVATVYGTNWWLHFLHRLAEYPPNVLTALADLADPGRVRFAAEY
jgi:proline dehydrogenase